VSDEEIERAIYDSYLADRVRRLEGTVRILRSEVNALQETIRELTKKLEHL
jgi:prefoldin subunit 5